MSLYRRYLFILTLFTLYIYYSSVFFTDRSSTSGSIRILYLIRTNSHFYDKRLIYLLETWISLVRDDTFFISDKSLPNISREHLVETQKICGSDVHSMSLLCCKTAHDFQVFQRHLSTYDWFCHFDDDQYVHVENLREFLSKFNSEDSHYIGRNSWSDTLKRSKEPFPSTVLVRNVRRWCLSIERIDSSTSTFYKNDFTICQRLSTRKLSRRYLLRFSSRCFSQYFVNKNASISFASRTNVLFESNAFLSKFFSTNNIWFSST